MDGGYMPPGERGRDDLGDLDPNKVAHELQFFGTQYAELYATAKLLELQTPIVYATLIQSFRHNPEGLKLSRADAEDRAKMSEEYQVHIETAVEARRQANIMQANWKAAQARFEAMRTAEATRRAEIFSLRGR